MPKKPLPPGWKKKTGGLFGDHTQKKKKADPEVEIREKVAERKKRIKIQLNERKISKAKEVLENEAEVIEKRVAGKVREEITNTVIYNFVVGEINRIVDGFKIDYDECRKETLEDFRNYLKAQATAIYQRVLTRTGRVL